MTRKSIVIPVDGSRAALDVVKSVLAEGRGNLARVHLVNVQPRLTRHASRYLPRSTRDGWREARSREALEPARRLVEAEGIVCTAHAGVGETAKVVALTAERLGASEIVLGTAKRGPLARLFAHSLCTRLLETATVPVRVIPAQAAPAYERYAAPVGIGLALLAVAAAD